MDQQISNLQPFEIVLDDERKIIINHSVFFKAIDGKVLATFTESSSCQVCPLCHAKPSEFNKLQNISNGKFNVISEDYLDYGLLPLHTQMRVFECLLKISYKKEIQGQARGVENKEKRDTRKLEIQKRFENILGLRVDQPIPGGNGNTNTGNVARRAFSDAKTLSEILEIDYKLIQDIRTLLIAISCHHNIDPEKFKLVAMEVAERFVKLYPWYNMPPTLHRLLIHGADVMRKSILPSGMFAEHAAEGLNKLYRYYRIFNARKNLMENNLFDMFSRLQMNSDPFISSLKLKGRHNYSVPIPPEVIELLADGENDENTQNCSIFDEVSSELENEIEF